MSFDKLPLNVFDCALVVVLVAGILRGRKHGMSEELFSLVKWLLIVASCAIFYLPAGNFIAQSSPFGVLPSLVMAYVLIVLGIFALFGLLRHRVGGKLLGSDVFGRGEYYLGMVSGLVRFACVVLVGLALLNARAFSPLEVRAMERFQKDQYGSNFFPTLHTAQETIFQRSLSGPWIRQHLEFFLIKPTQPEQKTTHQKEWSAP